MLAGPGVLRLQRDLRDADGRAGEPGASRRKIGLVPALQGPVRRIAAEHVMNCYVIWKFAENIDGAKQFLVDLVDHFARGLPGERVLQLPVLPLDRSGSRRAARQRPEGRSSRQVHGPRGRARLGDQRRLPGLRDGRHRRGLQHLRHPDDVRPRRARRGRRPRTPWPSRRRRSSGSSRSGHSRRRSDQIRARGSRDVDVRERDEGMRENLGEPLQRAARKRWVGQVPAPARGIRRSARGGNPAPSAKSAAGIQRPAANRFRPRTAPSPSTPSSAAVEAWPAAMTLATSSK